MGSLFSAQGKSDLVLVEGYVNSATYVQILQKHPSIGITRCSNKTTHPVARQRQLELPYAHHPSIMDAVRILGRMD